MIGENRARSLMVANYTRRIYELTWNAGSWQLECYKMMMLGMGCLGKCGQIGRDEGKLRNGGRLEPFLLDAFLTRLHLAEMPGRRDDQNVP
jgi:hypothetical protein